MSLHGFENADTKSKPNTDAMSKTINQVSPSGKQIRLTSLSSCAG
jgi:hypothetical protein